MTILSRHIALGILLCALSLILLLWHEQSLFWDQKLHFWSLDIPLGDALMLKTPHGKMVFMDGGADPSVLAQVGKVLPFWQKEFELLIITHPDLDHLAGGLEMLKKYRVRHVLITGIASASGAFDDFISELERQQIAVHFGSSAFDFEIDSVHFDTLWPAEPLVGATAKKVNNTSLVLRVNYGDTSLLLTGDIEKDTEIALLKTPGLLQSDVLKVAHHGSKTSSTPGFLEAVQPEVAVIAASRENRFGHPHTETMTSLEEFKVHSFINRDRGDIEVVSDGREIEVRSEHGESQRFAL